MIKKEKNFMKINEFIEAIKKNPAQANVVCKKIVRTKYIPVLEKRQLAELVYANSISEENGLVKVDSLSKYLIFTLLMLTRYTELEFSVDENGAATEDAIAEYDALCENDLVNKIIAEFADDYARANEIVNYVFQDNLAVVNTTEAIVGRAANGLLNIVGGLANVLAYKVDEMNFDLSELDFDQLGNVMSLLSSLQENK
jgi:hypothetical protein